MMKKVTFFLTVFLLLGVVSTPLIAQDKLKIVESSSKKVPTWFDSSEEEFIITSAIGTNLEALKQQCLDNVKMRIIESVAQNVQFSTATTINQTTTAEGMTDFNDKFKSELKTQAAKIPFISGVSISKVADSYWAKRYDKNTKVYSYIYSIKYPFPKMELKKMTMKFEKDDASMVEAYKELEAKLKTIEAIEEIGVCISKVDQLINYFFDETRENAAIALKNNFNALYDNVTIQTIKSEEGRADIQFLLNGKVILTSQRPILKSTSATALEYKQIEPNCYSVLYSPEFCEVNTTNEIQAKFRIGNKTVEHKIFFTLLDKNVEIRGKGEVHLIAKDKSDRAVNNVMMRMDIVTKNAPDIVVKGIILNIPGVTGSIFLEDIEMLQKGDITTVRAVITDEMVYSTTLQGTVALVRGSVVGVFGDNETPFDIKFSLPCKANW